MPINKKKYLVNDVMKDLKEALLLIKEVGGYHPHRRRDTCVVCGGDGRSGRKLCLPSCRGKKLLKKHAVLINN